jgi:hypothetical protein
VTCQRRDYIGADNAGLHPLLLRREGQDGEEVQNGAGIDSRTLTRTLKGLNVVKNLYGVLEYVDKVNKTREGYP